MLKSIKQGVILTTASLAFAAALHAGETMVSKDVVPPPEPEKVVSGWFSFDLNTHFISYGADVWGGGTSWSTAIFNPSGEISIKMPIEGLSTFAGGWADINWVGSSVGSSFSEPLQEIDIWAGVAYTTGPYSFKLAYQAWFYGQDTEQILDYTFAYDCLLKPTLLIHGRIEPGAAEGGGGSAGVFFVPSISHTFALGPVSLTPSAALGFCTDKYHGGGGGYAYTAIGANATIPLAFVPGDWSLHFGATYYNTSTEQIPNNTKHNFVTGNMGITLAF